MNRRFLILLSVPFVLSSCTNQTNLFDFLDLDYDYLYENTSMILATTDGGPLNSTDKFLKKAYQSNNKTAIQSYIKNLYDNGYCESDTNFSTGVKYSLEINLFADGNNYFIKDGFAKNGKRYQLNGTNSFDGFDYLGYRFGFAFSNANFYQNNTLINSISLNSDTFYFKESNAFETLDLRTTSLIMVNNDYGFIPQSDNTFSLYIAGETLSLFDSYVYECPTDMHLGEYLSSSESDKVTLTMKYQENYFPVYFEGDTTLDYGSLSYLLDWWLMEKNIQRDPINEIKVNGVHHDDGQFILDSDATIEFISLS